MPIYFVIVEYVQNPMMYEIFSILEVHQVDFNNKAQMDILWGKVSKAAYEGRRVQGKMFQREPDNPFRELAK